MNTRFNNAAELLAALQILQQQGVSLIDVSVTVQHEVLVEGTGTIDHLTETEIKEAYPTGLEFSNNELILIEY